MLKGIVKKLLNFRSLPTPTLSEKGFIADLKAVFREMPILETKNLLPSEAEWFGNMNRLRDLILSQDPRKFTRWDVVSKTMFVSFTQYIARELNYLKNLPNWSDRWRAAIKESKVGSPNPYIFYPDSSSNLIHHAYHIAFFESKTRVQVQNMDLVFEFGGGYGSICRLFYNLGFQGSYIIFDLPSFSALQIFYLKSIGLPVKSVPEFLKTRTGIVCVSDILLLKELLTESNLECNNLFLATWSISEAPIRIGDSILPLLSEFKSYLIAYQHRFGEVNNVEFFENWIKTKTNIDWHNYSIEHLPENNYLIGKELINL